MTYTLIAHTELGSDQSSITFSSIASTFTDLYLVLSARSSGSTEDVLVTFNGSGGTYSVARLLGTGSATQSDVQTNQWLRATANADTASTFSVSSMYVPNYTSANQKSASIEFVTENNGTRAIQGILAGLWTGTAAITSITLQISGQDVRQNSSATLYGITAGSSGGVVVS
jgi:hypothetical protein